MNKIIHGLLVGIGVFFFIMLIITEIMIIYTIIFVNPMTYSMYCNAGRCSSWYTSQLIWLGGALFFGGLIYSILNTIRREK